jgi:hypothetical protein
VGLEGVVLLVPIKQEHALESREADEHADEKVGIDGVEARATVYV